MPKLAANLSMLFTEMDFLDRFKAAADTGFKGVEYLFPYDFNINDITKVLSDNDLKQVLFNLPAGDFAGGERGIACIPDREEEFRGGIEQAISYAQALKCSQLNCLAGKIPKNVSYERVEAIFIENIRYAAARLEKENISLVIEMINTIDIPGFFLNTTVQALQILKKINHSNVKLQFDIYHMQIMEGDVCRTIKNNLDTIQHIQLADNPGRHEPGTGELNYHFIFSWLDDTGYKGWVGCEHSPLSSTEAGMGWLKTYNQI